MIWFTILLLDVAAAATVAIHRSLRLAEEERQLRAEGRTED